MPLLAGPAFDCSTRKIVAHLVLDARDDCALMLCEIFGPIVPLRGYSTRHTATASINAGPRPRVVYRFSHDGTTVQMLLDRVM